MAEVPGIIERALHDRSYHHLTYNIARIYAAAGQPEPALKWLRATAENGFRGNPLFQRDVYLNPIRDNPAFVAWLAGVRSGWRRIAATTDDRKPAKLWLLGELRKK